MNSIHLFGRVSNILTDRQLAGFLSDFYLYRPDEIKRFIDLFLPLLHLEQSTTYNSNKDDLFFSIVQVPRTIQANVF